MNRDANHNFPDSAHERPDGKNSRSYRSFADDPRELRPASANRWAAAALGLALLVVVIAVMLLG